MAKHHGVDVRNIVARMRQLGKSFRHISNLTGIPKSTVHRWISTHAVFKQRRKPRNSRLSSAVTHAIREFLSTQPFQTLKSIANHLQSQLSVVASSMTICRWLRHLRITRKQAYRHYKVCNDKIRQLTESFRAAMKNIDISEFTAIDETSICFTENSKYGYTPRRVPLHAPFRPLRKCKRRVTLVMAISADRVLHYEFYEGSCNTERFASFISNLPVDTPRRLLMDNVNFHKASAVTEMMDLCGLEPMYVPPYSPQYNPIEYVFSSLKNIVRRMVDKAGFLRDAALCAACKNIPSAVLSKSFRHCWKLCNPYKEQELSINISECHELRCRPIQAAPSDGSED